MTALRTIELDWPDKHPREVLDYAVDLSDDLEPNENAVGMAVSIKPSGAGELSVAGHTPPVYAQDLLAVVWLSGGVAGRAYLLDIEVATDQGRVFEYLVVLEIDATTAVYQLPLPPSTDWGAEATWGLTQASMAVAGAGLLTIAN